MAYFGFLTPQAAPVGFAAEAEDEDSIALSWTAPGGTVELYQSDVSNVLGSLLYTGSGSGFVHTGLDADTQYYYALKYTNPGSAPAYANATTDSGVPPLTVVSARLYKDGSDFKFGVTFSENVTIIGSDPVTIHYNGSSVDNTANFDSMAGHPTELRGTFSYSFSFDPNVAVAVTIPAGTVESVATSVPNTLETEFAAANNVPTVLVSATVQNGTTSAVLTFEHVLEIDNGSAVLTYKESFGSTVNTATVPGSTGSTNVVNITLDNASTGNEAKLDIPSDAFTNYDGVTDFVVTIT